MGKDYISLILEAQKNEITEYNIYLNMVKLVKDKENKKILKRIAKQELKHYNILKKITNKDVSPDLFKLYYYIFISSTLGLSFGLKFMERGESSAQEFYSKLEKKYPQLSKVIQEEEQHEMAVLGLISEERVEYASSVVLGLNDALVELSGALAGFTLILQNARLIGTVGLVMGVAAALSMTVSSYLSSKEEKDLIKEKNPFKAALYTGTAYIITVLFLVLPYFIFSNVYYALASVLSLTLIIVASYTFFISVAKNKPFWPRFLEMALLSLTVAAISFTLGFFIRTYLGVDA